MGLPGAGPDDEVHRHLHRDPGGAFHHLLPATVHAKDFDAGLLPFHPAHGFGAGVRRLPCQQVQGQFRSTHTGHGHGLVDNPVGLCRRDAYQQETQQHQTTRHGRHHTHDKASRQAGTL